MKKNSQVVRRLLISTLVLGGLVVTGTTSAAAADTASSTAEATSSQTGVTTQRSSDATSSMAVTDVADTNSDSSTTDATLSTASDTANSSATVESATTEISDKTADNAGTTNDDQQPVGTSLTTATKVTSTIKDTDGNELPQSAQDQLNDNLNQVIVSDKGKYSLADVMPDKLTTTDANYQLSGITITTTAGAQQHIYQIVYNADGTANLSLTDLVNPKISQTINNVSKENVDLVLSNGQLTGYGQPGTALQIAYLYTLLAATTEPTTPTDSNSGHQTGIVDDSTVASRTQADAVSTTLPTGTKVGMAGDAGLSSVTTQSVKQPTTITDKDDDTATTKTDVIRGTTKGSKTSATAGRHGEALVSKPMMVTSDSATTSATATGIESSNVAINDGTDSSTSKLTATLPQTGERGTAVVSVLGVALLTIAGWLGLNVKKRREE